MAVATEAIPTGVMVIVSRGIPTTSTTVSGTEVSVTAIDTIGVASGNNALMGIAENAGVSRGPVVCRIDGV